MARHHHTFLAITFALLVASAGFCAAPTLKAVKDGAGGVRLEWIGGAPDFEVFRSNQPDAVEDPANLLITVPVATHTDPTPPSDPESFYSVRSTGCDPDGIYVLDTPVFIDCPQSLLPNYLLDMQYIEVSQTGAQIAAGPVPAETEWTTPISCPSGTTGDWEFVHIWVDCMQPIEFEAAFVGPDTIEGTYTAHPPVGVPSPGCPACLSIRTLPFTARR